jgi:hypothetical protein
MDRGGSFVAYERRSGKQRRHASRRSSSASRRVGDSQPRVLRRGGLPRRGAPPRHGPGHRALGQHRTGQRGRCLSLHSRSTPHVVPADTRRREQRQGQSELSTDVGAVVGESAVPGTSRPRLSSLLRWPAEPKKLVAFLDGLSLQAGTHVHERDREGLVHLLRYALRPHLSQERLTRAGDGRVVLSRRRPLFDGTSVHRASPRIAPMALSRGI